MNIIADINWEFAGYLTGSFLVPFIIGWIVTKKWYWALLIAIVWTLFQVSKITTAPPSPSPVPNLFDISPTP